MERFMVFVIDFKKGNCPTRQPRRPVYAYQYVTPELKEKAKTIWAIDSKLNTAELGWCLHMIKALNPTLTVKEALQKLGLVA